MARAKRVGILTAGGDSPGLNAAIRGFGKAAIGHHGMRLFGFRDGFRGLAEDRFIELDPRTLAGILTVGGTILGTSRDKPHRMPVDGATVDMTETIVRTYKRHRLDGLVCIGGNGTAKNSLRLAKAGLNIVVLPKTIDNDVAETDATIGFATSLAIATDAIDRLHSTAHSHHRIILAEVMGHRAGWLTLAAGIAGGADVILIPEIPYRIESVVAPSGSARSPAPTSRSSPWRRAPRTSRPTSGTRAWSRGGRPPRPAPRSAPRPTRRSPRSTRTTPGTRYAWRTSWRRSPASSRASRSWAMSSAAAPRRPWTGCWPPDWATRAPTWLRRARSA